VRQLVQLQADAKKIEDAKIRLVGVSYDSIDFLKTFTEDNKITFPLLSDPESKVIDAYKLRNEDVRPNSRQDGIPHPVTVVVDKDGVVRAKLAYDVRKRHTTEELLAAAEKIREK
jgi:peroxiredoxin Q/BCP